ncbi:glutamyl aminopeptidase-like [Brienomyrus brachyistius]|uniref:glutamyl aminopeptidase-like n=1 Tax=Brienomyrus brachyistius TaxID=42636 RepID=UPI0020B1C79D|nr:glutamyl aminopeptidase-like [Brienomyrus brachyistius]
MMQYEDPNDLKDPKTPKQYCMRGKHVAIICAVVVVLAVTVGLAVGLTSSCSASEEGRPTLPPNPEERGPCRASNDTSGNWTNFRLPSYVIPEHYDLHMEPDLEVDTYTGTVSVSVRITSPTRYLWLHIRETFVRSPPRLQKTSPSGQSDVALRGCFQFKPQEYVVVEAADELPVTRPGEYYVLTLDFQGWLNGSLVGFYKTTYQENGVTKKIAATDHEPTDARKSFPCFDEPNRKATFTISITHDRAYNALSNMPIQKTEVVPGNKIKSSFEKSVPMSTYLVCFAVHQFVFVERLSSRGIPLRIYAQPLQIHTANYAADTTKIIFDYFETYFNMDYSMPKLDKMAIPDFGTGAMENWGLITYREANLLYDEKDSSSYNKQRVASVISHELVHQWFGNIVTMDWWDDLWLNEGFASFFEYVGVDVAEPTWKMRDIMLIDDVLPVMVDDALLSSHPIIVNVSSPAEITSVFDGISYSKGASILRMLEDLMGHDIFRQGCQQYLKDFQFKNAKTSDFWAALAKVSGLPVANIMDTWTRQMGYPVVDVSIGETQATLTQQRFLLDPNADPSQPPVPLSYKWTIPIKWQAIDSNKYNNTIFDKTNAGLTLPDYTNADGLIKLNKGHMGFYRTNYNISIWDSVSQYLTANHSQFTAVDRCGYIDDIFALARADVVDYGAAFSLTKYLSSEKDYIVWARVASSISYLQDMLMDDDDLYPKFQKHFRDQVLTVVRELGWTDTGSQIERLLRETVLGIACAMGDEESLNMSSTLFTQWLNDKISLGVNLRLLVYRYGMKTLGNEESWTKMFDRYQKATLAQEKEKLLYGLASVENVSLLDRLLEATKDEKIIRSQDVFTVIRYISLSKYGKTMAWDWVILNWEYLVNRYTINDRNLGRLVARITPTYNTELQLWQMQKFFQQYPEAGAGESSRLQAVETVRSNIDWVERNKAEIGYWLNSNVVY